MKKKITIEVDAVVSPSLKKMAKDAGRDFNWFVNDILLKAIGGNLLTATTNDEQNTDEFIEFAKTIPIGERIDKSECLQIFLHDYYTQKRVVSGKLFTNWLNKYAKNNGLIYTYGRNAYDRWFILSKGKITVKEPIKKVSKEDFFKWANARKLSMQGKVNKKECLELFIGACPYISQKLFSTWLNEYATSIGYDAKWIDNKTMMFLVKGKQVETVKPLFVEEKDDFGDVK